MFAASKSGSAADPTDPQFNYVTMLLHGDGTNGAQNNTFLDSSTNNFTITRNGNTTQGTFTPYGSNWSNYFDGSGDYLTATSPNLNGTWTIELWWFPLTLGTQQTFISFNNGSNSGINIFNNTSGQLVIDDGATGQSAFTTTTLTANQWNHVALVRNGTTTTGYINGVQAGSNSFTPQTTSQARIGGYNNGATPYYASGYISNVRVVNGTAVYTSAFTPSTTPLTAITNTSLLTCQSNRFIDNSTNTYTITKNGDVSVQRFSPFSPTTAYSTSVIGGSGYFDGSGDVLTVADNAALQLGAGDFSIEFWMWKNSTYSISGSNFQSLVISPTGVANSYEIQTHGPSNTLALGIATVGNIVSYATSNFVPSTFYHMVFTRSGNNFRMFVNGVLVSYATNTINFTSGNGTAIGGYSASRFWDGYITDVRIIKGSIPTTYQTSATSTPTSVFTPPTAPITTSSQGASSPALLLNMTNAGILDNAMMNDLETVGNAQISTSVKKYGTGSMYFDGTDDRLNMPSSPNLAFGTGDFTLEMWAYFTSTANFPTLTDSRANTSSTAGFNLGLSSAKVQLYTTSQLLIGSSTLSANTWYHIAVTRASGTLKIWLNGTQDATVANSTNWSDQTFIVGATPTPTNYMTGYIDDLRITKYARYTATFTPSTTAFPDKG